MMVKLEFGEQHPLIVVEGRINEAIIDLDKVFTQPLSEPLLA